MCAHTCSNSNSPLAGCNQLLQCAVLFSCRSRQRLDPPWHAATAAAAPSRPLPQQSTAGRLDHAPAVDRPRPAASCTVTHTSKRGCSRLSDEGPRPTHASTQQRESHTHSHLEANLEAKLLSCPLLCHPHYMCRHSLNDLVMSCLDSFKQSVAAHHILGVDVRSRQQQHLHSQAVALAGRQHQTAAPVIVAAADAAALLQHLQARYSTAPGWQDSRAHASGVRNIGLGPGRCQGNG